jgi:hypothetical protein
VVNFSQTIRKRRERHRREGKVKVSTLIMGLVLVLTIGLAVAFGVVSGYLIITGILNVFARRPQTIAAAAPVLAAEGVAGD